MDTTEAEDDVRASLRKAYDLAVQEPAVIPALPPSNTTWHCRKCGRAQSDEDIVEHYAACDGRNPGRCLHTWPRCRLAQGHVGRHYPMKNTQEHP